MRVPLKIVCLVAILALLGITAIAVHRHQAKQAVAQLYDGTATIPKGSQRISASVLRRIASADFIVVSDLRYLPSSVKESFCNVESCNHSGIQFDMVNPGDMMSTDFMLPGVPNKRLAFAAINRDSAIVVYERGGFVNFLRAIVLDFKNRKVWSATLNSHSIKNLRDLRGALDKEEYVTNSK